MGELAGGFESLDVSPSGRSTAVEAHIRPATADDVEACAVLSAQVSDIQHPDWMHILGRDVDMTDRLLVVAVRDQLVVDYGRAGLFDPPQEAPDNVAPAGYYLMGLVVDRADRRRTDRPKPYVIAHRYKR